MALTCFVFGQVIYFRQNASVNGASRIALTLHDDYTTHNFVVYEYERNFSSGELRKNPLFDLIVNSPIEVGSVVNIRGRVYYSEKSKSVVFKPSFISLVEPCDYEVCSHIGYII